MNPDILLRAQRRRSRVLFFEKKNWIFFLTLSGPGTDSAWFSGSACFGESSRSLRVFNFLDWIPLHMVYLTQKIHFWRQIWGAATFRGRFRVRSGYKDTLYSNISPFSAWYNFLAWKQLHKEHPDPKNSSPWTSPRMSTHLKSDPKNEIFWVWFTMWSGFQPKKFNTRRERELAPKQAEPENQVEPVPGPDHVKKKFQIFFSKNKT